jgi:hypothetical protein
MVRIDYNFHLPFTSKSVVTYISHIRHLLDPILFRAANLTPINVLNEVATRQSMSSLQVLLGTRVSIPPYVTLTLRAPNLDKTTQQCVGD